MRSTTPLSDATAVTFNAAIAATFSEEMDPQTISGTTFVVLDGSTPVSGAVSLVGITVVFTPTTNLPPNTTLTATISSGVKDLAGNAMAADYSWTFTTDISRDTTAPRVIATTPGDGATGIASNAPITATFSEEMDPLTMLTATFTVVTAGGLVPGTVEYVGLTALFTPNDELERDVVYTARISSAVTDLASNAMGEDYEWSFTTGAVTDSTPPQVTSTSPANDATDVAFNAPISATFSEPMDPLTISETTFTLFRGAASVPGTVLYVGVTAVFTPTGGVERGTLYTATITAGATDLAGNAIAADYQWSFTTGEILDDTAPTVSFTTPDDDAADVVLNGPITATFSEPLDPLTLSTATFTLHDGATPVPGNVALLGVTAVFTPIGGLASGTAYTATITTGVTDLAGNAIAADYQWSFTTETLLDSTAPQVVATNPADDAEYVALNAAIIATFSEPVDPATLSASTFTLLHGATVVPGTVVTSGATATFAPTKALDVGTLYSARIEPTVTDLAGNALGAAHAWSFTTGSSPDLIPPTVTSTSPEIGAIDVEPDALLTATLSEAMDPLTVSAATFELFAGATPVAGIVSYAGVTATFAPAVGLSYGAVYTAKISTGVTDLAGNPMVADFVWTFTTGPPPDTKAPKVTFTVPVDHATGVPIGGDIAAVFSEAMDPGTVTADSFTVQQLGQPVIGIVSYAGVTATFNPITPLAPNTIYSAVIMTSVTDLGGNPLMESFVWSFRTGATGDTTGLSVVSTNPANLDSEVSVNTDVTAVFDDVLDPLTLTKMTFTLEDGPTLIEGTVTATGVTAVFDPTDDLAADTEYTATISAEVMDLAGNPMIEDYVWTFVTGVDLDIIAPTVILTKPEDLAIDVPLDATVNATFSEDMDPLTITTATFEVTGPGNTGLPGTVTYDVLSMIATFTPKNELIPHSTYTATITMKATDLAGNALQQDHVWTFSTGELAAGALAIDLGTLSTFVAVAGAGLTNSNSAGVTTLNGDVGLSPTAMCMGDGSPCSELNPVINGTLYMNDPEGVAAQAKVDLTAAYVEAMALPVGTTVNDITGMVLPPGVYTSNSTMSIAVGGTVTLDGQGDSNATWVFQVGSSLTVNNSAQVLLINGAKARNVFWAVFASSTLGSNVSFHGSVLAGASNSVGTGSTVVGRLLCTTGQITLLSNTITLPPL